MTLLWTTLCMAMVSIALATGSFELEVLGIQNSRGELSDGTCCNGTCPGTCRTLFRLCLKEYQASVSDASPCTFGSVATQVVGGNSFSVHQNPQQNVLLQLPFSFRWPKTFTLLLDALHSEPQDHNGSYREHTIERHVFSGVQIPGTDWNTKLHRGRSARISYRYRVLCSPYYFGSTCSTLCRPRDDRFGHYSCDDQGHKECLQGWQGATCEAPVCRSGCHPVHGYCSEPGECRCRSGWKGDLCDQCIPYPGCKHGYCNGSPWQCICDLNWGGILCDGDLNYCGTHEPCLNGGTCVNTAPDNYTCMCPEGFSGDNCDIAAHPCASSPCLNQGTCTELNNTFSCSCYTGWMGDNCQININECESNPCVNGGTCLDLVDGYKCLCGPGWQGSRCQSDLDECEHNPCVNSLGCQNVIGDYLCVCMRGWSGKDCDHNVDDCADDRCLNGATCVDLVTEYHCACAPGFTGRQCQTNINECFGNPCLNEGKCVDLVAGFRCICSIGYKGKRCEIDDDLCNPNPCHNGGSCLNLHQDYACICPMGFRGKNCDQCDSPPCQSLCAVPVPNSSLSSSHCGDNGKCVTNHVTGASVCVCDPGYTGRYCHENINDCASTPCKNGGTCVDGLNSFQCFCQEGWEGRSCALNKNDCDPNPCQNNGTCIDAIGGYICNCKAGWKGKTCNSRHSQCDLSTCQNGGTCFDMGDTFRCHCKAGWEGHTCHRAKNPSCASSPCYNGATCVNIGSSFLCVCREGFEGPFCQKDSDDCSPNPCYNGGTCLDGVNWFMCACPGGFAGPDCRVDIDECIVSSPCAHGSTCINEIGGYKCQCPPYTTGQHCQAGFFSENLSELCIWKGQIYPQNSVWNDGCNACTCLQGKIRCTQMVCVDTTCDSNSVSLQPVNCKANNVCTVSTWECFTPPCRPNGLCIANNSIATSLNCHPNSAILSNNCAKITLFFDKTKMSYGVYVADICARVRSLPLSYLLRNNQTEEQILILCGIKDNEKDSIEITISSWGAEAFYVVSGVTKRTADLISRNHHNTSLLAAVREVKVETLRVNNTTDGKNYTSLLVILLSALILVILCCCLFGYCWQRKHSVTATTLAKQDTDKNINNLCRFHNPVPQNHSLQRPDQYKSFHVEDKTDNQLRQISGRGQHLPIDLNKMDQIGISKCPERSPYNLLHQSHSYLRQSSDKVQHLPLEPDNINRIGTLGNLEASAYNSFPEIIPFGLCEYNGIVQEKADNHLQQISDTGHHQPSDVDKNNQISTLECPEASAQFLAAKHLATKTDDCETNSFDKETTKDKFNHTSTTEEHFYSRLSGRGQHQCQMVDQDIYRKKLLPSDGVNSNCLSEKDCPKDSSTFKRLSKQKERL